MINLEGDKNILLSIINMNLRDKYDSLDKLCDIENIDKNILIDKLKDINYFYDEKLNQFK